MTRTTRYVDLLDAPHMRTKGDHHPSLARNPTISKSSPTDVDSTWTRCKRTLGGHLREYAQPHDQQGIRIFVLLDAVGWL